MCYNALKTASTCVIRLYKNHSNILPQNRNEAKSMASYCEFKWTDFISSRKNISPVTYLAIAYVVKDVMEGNPCGVKKQDLMDSLHHLRFMDWPWHNDIKAMRWDSIQSIVKAMTRKYDACKKQQQSGN